MTNEELYVKVSREKSPFPTPRLLILYRAYINRNIYDWFHDAKFPVLYTFINKRFVEIFFNFCMPVRKE